MAQVIAPEIWQEGIEDNTLLPNRATVGLFTGSGVKIANNIGEDGVNAACRVWDMQISDYITDYDDRRLNGLSGKNSEGRDGWGASAYGVFQDVRFDSKVYTMGRHRSVAYRIFDEAQYSGNIGAWGDATTSNVETSGQNLMKTAQIITKAKDRWEKQVLGPDIDKYTLFAVMNGHISGRWVQDNPDQIFSDEGQWVAQPGMVQGQAIQPRFAPIHCIEWDDNNIPLMLQTIKVTWNNLNIPQDNRVIIIDPFYEYSLLSSLTGKGIPSTDSAYTDLQNGSFTRLMGWEFNFEVPTKYFPRLYVDDNLNVVHSADGTAPYDAIINSVDGGNNDDLRLQNQLVASDRMNKLNFIRTEWDEATGKFVKVVTNYPLGQPGASPYFGEPVTVAYDNYGKPTTYPFTGPGAGYGLENPTGPQGQIVRRQTIGCAIYRPAAQMSQEYSNMLTAEGETRGKFTEMVIEVKYDAWVIDGLSHGIMPIIDAKENTGTFAIPVEIMEPDRSDAVVTGVTVVPTTLSIGIGQEANPRVTVTGTGKFDHDYRIMSSNVNVARVSDSGRITGVSAGTATITYTSVGDPTKTATVQVTVTTTPGA